MASINVNDILSKPYAYSFANSSTCEIQSKDLEKSVKTAAKTPLESLLFFYFLCHVQLTILCTIAFAKATLKF